VHVGSGSHPTRRCLKWIYFESDHSSPSNGEAGTWSFNFAPPYVFRGRARGKALTYRVRFCSFIVNFISFVTSISNRQVEFALQPLSLQYWVFSCSFLFHGRPNGGLLYLWSICIYLHQHIFCINVR
jgi:hypothetical protein